MSLNTLCSCFKVGRQERVRLDHGHVLARGGGEELEESDGKVQLREEAHGGEVQRR